MLPAQIDPGSPGFCCLHPFLLPFYFCFLSVWDFAMRLQRHLPILTMGPRERAYPSAGQLPLPHRSGIREFMRQVQLLLLCLRSYPGGTLVFCLSGARSSRSETFGQVLGFSSARSLAISEPVSSFVQYNTVRSPVTTKHRAHQGPPQSG